MLMCLFVLLSSFHLIVTNSSSSIRKPLCHDNDSCALLQIKQSFLVDEYASKDPSSYPQVAIGQIPSFLENFTLLTFLSLSFNSFSVGTLAWLSEQTKLTGLDLHTNKLIGEIPQLICNMTSLMLLDLSSNNLSGRIPPCLANFSKSLFILDLGSNSLDGPIPQTCPVPNNLRLIDLSENQFQGKIPRSLDNCMMLEHLALGNNQINDIFLFDWPTGLLSMHISQNCYIRVRILPVNPHPSHLLSLSIENMGSALYLFMFMRFLLLPSSFYLMVTNASSAMQHPLCHASESSALLQFKQSFLIDEDASDDPSAYPKVSTWKSHGEGEESDCCSWDGVECDKETGHVIGLHLASSCLYGSINSSNTLFSLVHLSTLDLSDNDFNYSEVPHKVGQLSRLRSLNLSGCGLFSGELPASIGRLVSLTVLDLDSCKFTGMIPSSLSHLTQLSILDLSFNLFTGQISQSLTSLSSSMIDLSENQFQGQIPISLANCTMLEQLVLGNNQIHDIFPFWLGALPQLQVLILRSNRFHGQIPTSIGNLKGLHLLNLGRNNITGHIPSSLMNLTQMESLDLSQNKLSGEIPWQLTRMTFLAFFNVSNNHLTGPIPQGKQFATFPNTSFDGNPGFHYYIPRSLANCTMLEHLALGNNQIDDIFPFWIGALPQLQVLILTSNRFHGAIGRDHWYFIAIDFSSNNFKGQIPTSIGSLKGLHLLNLASNNPTSHIPSSWGT
ncbi:unnamed protein product, partial [Vitis vinifera]